jgi:hypothetical protein
MIKIEKITELEYDELVTLRVIEQDETLLSIFREDMKLSFSMLYRLSKDGSLNKEIKETILSFFNNIISVNKDYVILYRQFINKPLVETEEIIIPVVESVTIKTKEIKKELSVSENKLPRRYGKEAIKKDIEAQGGKPNTTQLTAIALNDLKNIYGVLNTRLIKDIHSDKKVLSDEEYREIRAAITILQNKLKPILKKR